MIKRGALAAAAGCHIETVRFYERIGLMPPPGRTASGHRVYAEGDVQRLAFILRARRLGLSIEELRALLGLVDGGDYTCAEVRDLALDHLGVIRRKIADLRTLERQLRGVVAQCDGGARPDCPIVDMLSAAPAGTAPLSVPPVAAARAAP